MSPELVKGEVVDPAACDAYAMGILIWSMLSGGKHPYAHLKAEGVNHHGMMARVATQGKGSRPVVDAACFAGFRVR